MRCDLRGIWARPGRMAAPLTALAMAAALVSGGASGIAKGTPQPHRIDPNVQNQAAVLIVQNNHNDVPAPYCTGAAPTGAPGGTQTPGGTPDLEPAAPCTVAVFGVGIFTRDLSYSTTPCTATGLTLAPCTAAAFKPTTPAPAITGYRGSSCQPQACLLFLVLTQEASQFSAPGVCTANFYLLNTVCTVADIETAEPDGTSDAHGGTTLKASATPCPAATASNPDLEGSCTATPFLPTTMALTLPPATTATFPPGGGSASSSPDSEVNIQSLVVIIAPANDTWEDFAPVAPCGTLGLAPTAPCLAAQFTMPANTTSLTYPGTFCAPFSQTANGPCTSNAFQKSPGQTALAKYPGSMAACSTYNTTPLANVDCRVFYELVNLGGEYDVPATCTTPTAPLTSYQGACVIAVIPTDADKGGETVPLPTIDCGSLVATLPNLNTCTATPYLNMGTTVTLPQSVYFPATPAPSPSASGM